MVTHLVYLALFIVFLVVVNKTVLAVWQIVHQALVDHGVAQAQTLVGLVARLVKP